MLTIILLVTVYGVNGVFTGAPTQEVREYEMPTMAACEDAASKLSWAKNRMDGVCIVTKRPAGRDALGKE